MRRALLVLVATLSIAGSASAQTESAQAEPVEAPPPVVLDAPPPPVAVAEPAPPPLPEVTEWPSSSGAPGPSVGPHEVHREDVGRLVLGGVLFGLGYVGAVTWGAHVLADLPLGALSCNDTYGGLMLVPAIGPLIGMGVSTGCVQLQFEEVLLPIVLSLAQLAGLAWFLAGLAGNTDVEYDHIAIGVSADATGGRVTLGGQF